MTRLTRLAVGALAAAAGLLASVPADAQVACDTLPNPIVVAGSVEFEPVLQEFAVRLAAESPPATVVSVAAGGQSTSCAAVKGVVDGTDFGGLPGRYYTRNGAMIVNNTCLLPRGQRTEVAISDLFYESCSNVPQPKPADIADVTGPVQATVFVVPKANTTTRYITHEEVRAIYGCGVSSTRRIAGLFGEPDNVFCRDAATGTQFAIAKNIGVPASALVAPKCVPLNNDGRLIYFNTSRPPTVDEPNGYTPPADSIGFIAGGQLDRNRTEISPLAFQALGQTRAFYPDAGPTVADRRNVRDGHYPIWGYVHMIARTTGGSFSPQASELIGWINGTKISSKIDHVAIEAGAGLTPQCAMKVERSSDGGPLGPYSPTQTCFCGFEAVSSRSTPAACMPCLSNSACPCGSSCRHGFCE